MAFRTGALPLRRMLSGTARSSAAEKLPFEKPLFESDILRKAQQEQNSYKRLEFLGNVGIVLVGSSVIARVGYYVMHGKEGGAEALPKRAGR